ncbi:hypothetical protein MASR1M12_23660 [Erysipelotrichia bacterium]
MRKHGRKLAPGLCLAFLLLPLIFFLTFLAGCGGGGSSGGGVAGPAATSMITGRVIAPDELLQRLNLMSASSAAAGPRATVWLENNPDDMQLTDSSGNFSFSGLAPGVAYRVVCRYDIAATGELYLVRSGEILIAATAQAGQTGDLTLEKGKYTISGILRNQFNQPVANARMSLWGIRFKTLSDGTFITPPMPESAATEKINVQADGYRQMTLELPFIHSQDMMPGIDVTLSDVSEPNFAPLLFFKQAPQKVAPGEKIALQIAVFDPDELAPESFKPVWKPLSGTIEETADRLSVFWTAPQISGLATVSVSVTDSRGASGTATIGLAVGGDRNPAVRVDSISPSSAEPGMQIVIKGSGFSADPAKVKVSFNGIFADIVSSSETQIVTTVPSGATTGVLVISVPGGEKSAGVFAVIDPGLALSPAYGPPGTIVGLSGRDFGTDQTAGSILVNGVQASIQSWSDSLIRFIIPEKAVGGVVTLSLRAREKTAGFFKVTRIFDVSSSLVTKGSEIVITGEGWGEAQAASSLVFAGDVAATIKSWSESRIVLLVPTGARSGDLTATVQGISFVVRAVKVNSVDSVSPDRGIAGVEIEIAGTGFGASQGTGHVKIDDKTLEIIGWSENLIRAKVPEGTRPGDLAVFAAGINSNGVPVVISAITSISHVRRPAGTVLQIDGYGFGSNTGFVLFGEIVATTFKTWKEDLIEVVIPANAPGNAPVVVSSMGVRTPAVPFFVTSITGADQDSGWIGREVVISGGNLGNGSGGDKVTFNGVTAPVISWNDSSVSVRVPEQATSGQLVLEISGVSVTLEEEFSVFTDYDYAQAAPDWSGKRVNSKPLLPGLAQDSAGNVFITDYDNGWVWRIASDGTQSKFGNLDKPWGIALDEANGRIFVSESGKHRVQIFDLQGNGIGQFGTLGAGDGQFSGPRGLILDQDGRLYIADAGNSRVQVFTAAANPVFITSFGTDGNGDGQLTYPSGVAVDSNFLVYVADAGNNRIQRFTPDSGSNPTVWAFSGWLGSKDPNVATPGWLNGGSGLAANVSGAFKSPYGVGLAGANRLLVADTNNNRVQVFDAQTGLFVSSIGASGVTSGQYNQPLFVGFADDQVLIADSSNARIQKSGLNGEFIAQIRPDTSLLNTRPGRIAVDSVRRRVYVLDTDDGSISVFGLDGSVIEIIGSSGAGSSQFYKPEGLALDGNGNLYVADTGNARIQIISPEGSFSGHWGVYGTGGGQFVRPVALAVSPDSRHLYVVDRDLHRIQKFTVSGQFVKGWGSNGASDDHFKNPSGIACSRNGELYIADTGNHRIKKYSAEGVLIGWWGSYDAGAQSFWLDPGSQKTGAVSDSDGGFDTPVDVAVDSEGHVFVADSGNFRVQKFASEQAERLAGGFITEIYLGESLSALSSDAWATVYAVTESGFVRRFFPEP